LIEFAGRPKNGILPLSGEIGNAPTDLPVYPEVPYAFFGFQLAPFTYSTFGILRFTVLSLLGRRELYQRPKEKRNRQKSVRRQATFRRLQTRSRVGIDCNSDNFSSRWAKCVM
jgi:hypothetical protein